MKKYITLVALFLIAGTALAAVTTLTYTTTKTSTISTAATALKMTPAQFATTFPNALLASGQTFSTSTGTVTPPPPPPPPTTGEIVITNAYTTAYGWPDNTPAGNNTDVGGVSGHAGGTGTFADPITMATGFSLIGGKEVDDYAAGTKFYDPNLRKYFAVGDTCGDGNSPQTEACHVSEIKGTIQLDLWVGGQGLSKSGTLACEDSVTRTGTLIENPASNYVVVAGPVYSGTCAQQFGDLPVTQ